MKTVCRFAVLLLLLCLCAAPALASQLQSDREAISEELEARFEPVGTGIYVTDPAGRIENDALAGLKTGFVLVREISAPEGFEKDETTYVLFPTTQLKVVNQRRNAFTVHKRDASGEPMEAQVEVYGRPRGDNAYLTLKKVFDVEWYLPNTQTPASTNWSDVLYPPTMYLYRLDPGSGYFSEITNFEIDPDDAGTQTRLYEITEEGVYRFREGIKDYNTSSAGSSARSYEYAELWLPVVTFEAYRDPATRQMKLRLLSDDWYQQQIRPGVYAPVYDVYDRKPAGVELAQLDETAPSDYILTLTNYIRKWTDTTSSP